MLVSIKVTCWHCGKATMLNVDSEGMQKWGAGTLIQDALPELSAGERELLISRTCDKCYNALWPDE